MFPLPRVLFAMARDGLLFAFLSKVSKRQAPAAATLAAGVTAAIMAFLFDLKALVDMMSIGTLLAYSLVAVCVLILRYQPDASCDKPRGKDSPWEPQSELTESESHLNMIIPGCPQPTEKSSATVNIAVSITVLTVCLISTLTTYYGHAVLALEPWVLALLGAAVILLLSCIVIIYRQPQTNKKVSFMVPLLPFLPIISILVNVYLMVQLNGATWVRFSVWMAMGFTIYFGYGIWHSVERHRSSISAKETTIEKEQIVVKAIERPQFILQEKNGHC